MPDEDKKLEETKTPEPVAKESNVDYKDSWMRARADYENLKKEAEGQKMEWVKFANSKLLIDLLPVLQHFQMAMKFVPAQAEKESWVIGVKHIQKLLEDFMEKNAIKKIETIGKPFDPLRHEAVGKKKVEGKEAGLIIEEAAPGFTLNEKVIQVAKVIVAE